MKNEEQQSEKKKVHVDIEIYIIKIKEIISAIEYWYQYPFSIILLLLEFQKEIKKNIIILPINLTGMPNEIKEESEIYSLDIFLRKIKEPIINYIEKKEYNDGELKHILNNLNNFLFRLRTQFNSYLAIQKRENGENIQKTGDTVDTVNEKIGNLSINFEFNSCITQIEEIHNNLTVLSLFFQIQNMNEKLENKVDEKIKNHDKKISEHEKAVKEQEKNMMNIMAIFISIFSLIGINLSFFSHFESSSLLSWVILILIINITLGETIKLIFNLIHLEKNEKKNISYSICDKFFLWIKEKNKKN